MNIALYDPDSADRRPWHAFIGSDHTITDIGSLNKAVNADLLFVHGSYLLQDSFNSFRKLSPSIPLVVISGAPPHEWWKDDSCSYWRKSIVDKPGQDFTNCCQRFLRRVTEYGVLEFGLLEPSCEAEVAFRLLCEAWKIKNIDGKSDCGGITIHSPGCIEDWLEPFFDQQLYPDEEKEKAAEIERRIQELSRLIDGSEDRNRRAESVLKAVGDDETLRTMIGKLLKREEGTSAQA